MHSKKSLTKTKRRKTETAGIERENDAVRGYLDQPYSRILLPESNGSFSAEVLEFSGCIAQGSDPNEAFANLEKAAKTWILASLKAGKEIPPPSVNYGYSGKFVLRLPRDLHRIASRKAERDAVSLNQCIVSSVAAWVGADNLFERIAARIQKMPIIFASIRVESGKELPATVPFLVDATATTGTITING